MAACYDDDVNDVISRWFQRLLRQNFTPLNFESLWASCMNVILSIISYAFYEWNEDKRQLTINWFIKSTQNDVQDDVMRDANWS